MIQSTLTAAAAEFLTSLPAPLTREGQGAATVTQVAARVRQELALAVRRGVIPAGTEFSVRALHHTSLDVRVTAWTGAVFVEEYIPAILAPASKSAQDDSRAARLTPELQAALVLVEHIADRHNYDRSDLMTDYHSVGYYLSVGADPVESTAKHTIRVARDPEFATLVSCAREAAQAIGPKAARAIFGSHGIESACEWTLGRAIKMAVRAGGKPMAYDRRRGWIAADA